MSQATGSGAGQFLGEGVLKKASSDVLTTSQAVKSLCDKMDGEIQSLTGWSGMGRAAVDDLNRQWQEKRKIVLDALNYLAEALNVTQQDTSRIDDDIASMHRPSGANYSRLNA